MRGVSVLAGLLAGILATGSALAADCPSAETAAGAAVVTPVAQLVCRDAALGNAMTALDNTVAALGETTDAMGRAAIDAAQTLWRARRDEICQVATADLTDAKTAQSRTECLLRATAGRTAMLEEQRVARGKPVAELPLTITDAAAPRLVAVAPRPAALTRPVSVAALVGRWAKADPVNRVPVDNCRSSYLDVTPEQTLRLVDPRIPDFPIEGQLASGAEPIQGLPLTADGGGTGMLRLEAAETPRLDRLVLRMDAPSTFAATFVRCR